LNAITEIIFDVRLNDFFSQNIFHQNDDELLRYKL